VIGIGLAAVLLYAHRRINEEQLVALACAMLTLLFVIMFPVFGVLGTWLDGAYITWFAGWLELAAMFAWMSAAGAREAHAYASLGQASSCS
jgi:hypothetical protein